MASASESKPHLEVIKGEAVPLSPAHRELLGMFIDYLRDLPELNRNSKGNETVGLIFTDPYYPLIALLLNRFSVRDFGPSTYDKKYSVTPWEALPVNIRDELFDFFHGARFTDSFSERRRAILGAEVERRLAGEAWNRYVESRTKLGLKATDAPWNVKGHK
jgi:hypothetical protein